jgi:hypothetical protein
MVSAVSQLDLKTLRELVTYCDFAEYYDQEILKAVRDTISENNGED